MMTRLASLAQIAMLASLAIVALSLRVGYVGSAVIGKHPEACHGTSIG